jgi:DNA-binding MarR family transcriptional regulator
MKLELLNLGRAIKQIQYRHQRALDARLSQLGISLVQWDALRAIDRLPESSAHALAQETFQTDQAFSTLASRLLQRGWIKRRAGPGRSMRHQLTSSGQQVLQQGYPLATAALTESFAGLAAADREQLLHLLQRILHEPLS